MIGTLTNDITRLCGEIAALRDSRGALRTNLARDRDDRKDTVSQMLGGFHNSQAEMAAKTKAELHDFVENVRETVSGLKQGVAALREELLDDIAGAHRAWNGHIFGRVHSRMAAEERPKKFVPKGKKKKR